MPDPSVSTGLQPPATPVDASPHAATVRAAHLAGSREIFMLPVTPRALRDQQQIQACVSCASAAAMEIRDRAAPALSAMSHYHLAREKGLGNLEGRLTLQEGLMTLQRAGICSQHLHAAPMTDAGVNMPLTPDARADARNNRLLRQGPFPPFESIGSGSRVMGIRHHVKRLRPVLLGFRLPLTYPDGSFLGDRHQWDNPAIDLSSDGHCVVVIGFDDFRQALRVQDSRGRHPRFQEGCWWMGYPVADSPAILVAASVMVRS